MIINIINPVAYISELRTADIAIGGQCGADNEKSIFAY